MTYASLSSFLVECITSLSAHSVTEHRPISSLKHIHYNLHLMYLGKL